MSSYFDAYPCLLCGTIHSMVVLSYPGRKWRSPEDGLDHKIRIICIICAIAREQGKQYTKRLLPEFLRPYCRIRLDLDLEYYTVNYIDSGKYDWEDACAFLGCIDTRTARRHLADIQSNVPRMNLELSHVMSHKSGFITDTESPPDTPPAMVLALRVVQVRGYHVSLYGNLPPITPGFYTPLGIIHTWFCGRNLSTSYVLKTPLCHDTS
jgi:hypothetical protein